MVFVINKNGHFFKIEKDLINLNDLVGVEIFENPEDAANQLGMSEKVMISKCYQVFLDEMKRPFALILGALRPIDLADCEFNNNGVICRCYSIEDYISEFTL